MLLSNKSICIFFENYCPRNYFYDRLERKNRSIIQFQRYVTNFRNINHFKPLEVLNKCNIDEMVWIYVQRYLRREHFPGCRIIKAHDNMIYFSEKLLQVSCRLSSDWCDNDKRNIVWILISPMSSLTFIFRQIIKSTYEKKKYLELFYSYIIKKMMARWLISPGRLLTFILLQFLTQIFHLRIGRVFIS